MPSQRNKSWRKPVPKLIPDSSPQPSLFRGSTIKRLRVPIVSKDVPPLPDAWHEKIEHVLNRDKRHAVYIPSHFDDGQSDEYGSLYASSEDVATQEPAGLRDVLHYPATVSKETIEKASVHTASVSRKLRPCRSLPHIYRPPTPPRPRRRPRAAATQQTYYLVSPNVPSCPVYPDLNPQSFDTTSNFSPFMSPAASFEVPYSREKLSYMVAPKADGRKSRSRWTSERSDPGPRLCGDTFSSIWGDIKALGEYVRIKINDILKSENAHMQTW